MAQKRINDLQLRSDFDETCNFPTDDLVQTWRVTGQQVLDYVDGNIDKHAIADRTVLAKTTTYTILNTDRVITANAAGGAFTLTLPTASGINGRVLQIKKIDSTINVVTIDGNSSETIDGSLTKKLCTQYESITLVSDGTNWLVLDRKIPSFWASSGLVAGDFVGFGTVSNIALQTKREGQDLLVRGRFQSGVSTGTEARVPLKLGGATLTAKGSEITTREICGTHTNNKSGGTNKGGFVLIEPSATFLNFGAYSTFGSSGGDSSAKANGNATVESSDTVFLQARIPILDWEE